MPQCFFPVDVDYSNTTCVLIFHTGSGPNTTQSCYIPILDDTIVEDDESINVNGSIGTRLIDTAVFINDADG